MGNLKDVNPEYREWIQELSKRFRQSQIKAAVKVNTELLKFYWSLGEDIVKRQVEKKYGAGIMDILSRDLQAEFPNITGFSRRNLFYAKEFYLIYYQQIEKVPQVVAQFDKGFRTSLLNELFSIPWGHHRTILDKVKGNP